MSGRADLPLYVGRGGEQVHAGPSTMRRTRVMAFLLAASQHKLDIVLDNYLNEPSNGAVCYRSIAPLVLLYGSIVGAITSDDPSDRGVGQIEEYELGIWVPAVDMLTGQVAAYPCYVFTDSTPTIASGREMLGMPKAFGHFAVPHWGQPSVPPMTVSTWGLDEYGKRSTAVVTEVVKIDCRAEPRNFEGAWSDPASIVRHVSSSLGAPRAPSTPVRRPPSTPPVLGTRSHGVASAVREGSPVRLRPARQDIRRGITSAPSRTDDFVTDVGVELLAGRAVLVMLKQFRDIEQIERACYQAVVEVGVHLGRVYQGGPLEAPDWSVTVVDVASEPIRRELGLAPNPIEPESAFWVELDLQIGPGRVCWEAR